VLQCCYNATPSVDLPLFIGFWYESFLTLCLYFRIEELFVKEEYRRKHLGTQLIKRLLERYKKLGVWALFVMTKEEDADVQAFYKSLGFNVENTGIKYSRG